MKKSVRTTLTVLLVLVFLFSGVQLLQSRREKAAGSSSYDQALAIASPGTSGTEVSAVTEEADLSEVPQWIPAAPEEEDPHIQTLKELDLEALREVNPDVVGWILIPDTKINYPLMQGTDNDYYLEHTWDKKSNAVGSIFLEEVSSPDFTDFNTIVYGHNMMDGSMFAGLRNYREPGYWEAHPHVYIRIDEGVYRYDIFSSYLADVEGSAYIVGFSDDALKSAFLEDIRAASVMDTGLEPAVTDRILTLSTCSGRGYSTRWVVHARLKMILSES